MSNTKVGPAARPGEKTVRETVKVTVNPRWLISLLLLFVKGFQFRDTLKSNRPVFQVWRVDGSALDLGPELVHERVVLVT